MLIDQEIALLLKNTIQQEGWIELPSFGKSMFPVIKQGQVCRFAPFRASSLKKGDILLVYTSSQQLVAHRFYKEEIINGKWVYIFKGDTNLGYDEPVNEQQILGKLTMIYKKNKTVQAENGFPAVWGKWILSVPFLSVILHRVLTSNLYFLRSSK